MFMMSRVTSPHKASWAILLPAPKMGITAPCSSEPGKLFALFLRVRLQLDSHKGRSSVRMVTYLAQPGQFDVIRPN